jgi:hypothetical protein
MQETVEGLSGTIADLREWLNQFEDTDTILFSGGEDGCGEFMVVVVNNNEVVCC